MEKIDREPTPWLWGINGATGVLASVLAIMIGITWGINVTMLLSGICYLLLIPTALRLLALTNHAPARVVMSDEPIGRESIEPS